MIDVLKRLTELDSTNPNVVTESTDVTECGMDGMSSMIAPQPHTPASINMTAGSGDELANMLSTIMQLAGVHKVGDEHMGAEPPPAVVSVEPAMSAGDSMRSVIDKMHADGAGGDNVSQAHGDIDNDGDHDMADHEAEKDDEEETDEGIASMAGQALGSAAGTALGGPVGGAIGGALGNAAGSALSGDEETDEGAEYDNTPADPTKAPEFDAEEFAHQENPPGAGAGRRTTQPNAYPTMEQITQNLFAEYEQFINEDKTEITKEYSMDDLRKDAEAGVKASLDKQSNARIAALKNPPKEKGFMAQVGDKIIGGVKGAAKGFAGGTDAVKESESLDDIAKLAGLK